MPTSKDRQSTNENLTRDDIERLIELVHEKGFEEFELEHGETRIRMVVNRPQGVVVQQAPQALNQAAAPAPVPATSSTPNVQEEDDPNLKKVTSPMVGTFYRAPSPGAKSFAEVGDRVDEESVLCIIEAMKLMNEIKAEVRGTIKKILVENAQPVEYGQTLFLVEPS